MISILLPAYKANKLLHEVFVPGLKNVWNEHKVEVLLWDNGGNEEFLNQLSIRSDVHPDCLRVFGTGENIGLNKALNLLAKEAEGEYFYLPHTDMIMLPGCLEALVKEVKNLPPTSYLLCSRSIEPGFSHIPSQIIKDYGNDVNTFQKDKLMAEYRQYVEKKVVVNARMPFFLHRKLWERIGGVDENYFSYCTDDDLIQQCYDAGVRRFWMVGESLVYHLQGKSNQQQTVDRDSQKPYEYFVEKWKKKYPDVHHPGQYHPKLIPFETRIK